MVHHMTFLHKKNNLAYFTFTASQATETAFSKKPVVVAKTIPKSGQTIFAFDGLPLTVVRGSISRIVTATETTPATIRTTLTSGSLFSGTPVVDTAGAVIGIALVSEGEISVVLGTQILEGLKP